MAMSESAFEPTTQCENHTWMGSRIFPRATHKNRSLFSVSTLPMTCGNDEKTDPYFFSWLDRLKGLSSLCVTDRSFVVLNGASSSRNTIFCSEAFVSMFGHSKAEVLSKNRAGDFAFLQVRAGEIPFLIQSFTLSRLNNSNWDVCLNVVSVRGRRMLCIVSRTREGRGPSAGKTETEARLDVQRKTSR